MKKQVDASSYTTSRGTTDLDQSMRAQMARQDKKITALESQILLRDRSINSLTELLKRLLGPEVLDG